MKRFLATNNSGVLLLQRIVLGLVMFPHGAQKVLGWYGGYGWGATLEGFQSMGIPYVAGVLVILAESLGALGLIAGFLTRLSAFGIIATQLGAIVLVHLPFGFFMNWAGTQKGEGVEYALLTLGLAVPLMIWGGGKASVDRALSRG
jgi:putative oxidoreductase